MLQFNSESRARNLARVASSAALALALVCPVAAHAAEASDAAAEEGGISDIVVMARKRAEASQTVPLAITAVGEKELATRSVIQVADVKTLVPSISMQSDQYTNFGVKMGIRGQHSTDSLLQSQPSVGIYMDGVYVANTAGLMLSNMADVKQMEVLKGPQGTLFGRNTTGGAVVITTNLPSYDETTVNMKLGAGNFGRMEGAVTANLPLASNAALRMTGQYFNSNGYAKQDVATNKNPKLTSGNIADQQAYSFRAALMMDPSDSVNVVLRGDVSYAESHGRMQKLFYVKPVSTTGFATAVALGIWGPPTGASGTAASGAPNISGLNSAGISTAAYTAALNALNADPTNTALQSAYGAQYGALLAAAWSYGSSTLMSQQPADPYTTIGDTYGLGHINEWGGSATITFDLTDSMALKSTTAYRHMNWYSDQDSDATAFALLNSFGLQQRLDVFSQELNLSGEAMAGKLNWTLGGFYFKSQGEDYSFYHGLPSISPNKIRTQGHFTQESVAFYGQANVNITDELRLTGGLRYTWEKQTLFNKSGVLNMISGVGTCDSGGTWPNCGATLPPQSANNVSYLVSLDYKITPDVMVYVRTARGFKGGGTNERGGIRVGQAFRPEQVTDYEIGLKSYLLDRKVRLNIAAYQSEYKDIQRTVIVPAGSSVTSIIDNAASARIKGVEVDLLVQPVEGLSMFFSGAYTDPRYKKYVSLASGADLSGNSFQAVAKWAWSAGASYDIALGSGILRPSFDYSYQSSVNFSTDSNSPQATPNGSSSFYTIQGGYGLINARLAYEFNDGKSSVAVWGKNLADKLYKINTLDVAQALGFVNGTFGAPRTFGIEFKHQF